MTGTNVKDMGFKLLWTMLNAGVAWGIVEVTEADVAWGAVALAGLQLLSSWLRQKLGQTPPDAHAS